MKTLSSDERRQVIGPYLHPIGLYDYIKSLPFLGTVTSDVTSLVAGEWTEVKITYTVGGSGLADGAWIKGTFKFYSDWALFQTSDSSGNNYISAEYIAGPLVPGQTPATVQDLLIRFDQKGHERPFQKAIIIDIVDGYLNPGDQIIVRLGDRRFGGEGTRVQTFVEEGFKMRWYIDPVGTSRFAAIKPDLSWDIRSGPVSALKLKSPRLVRPGVQFPVYVNAEDRWGNTAVDLKGFLAELKIISSLDESVVCSRIFEVPNEGWSYAAFKAISFLTEGDFLVFATFKSAQSEEAYSISDYMSVWSGSPVPRIFFADLHVHSDDTVGTNSTSYNFGYAQKIAGLDIVGYTANDFNITAAKWKSTLDIIQEINSEGEFVVFPGTEWCGNSAAGGDHNVVFLDDPSENRPEFPLDKHGNVARSFEWNEDGPSELQPGAWPLDELYATYAHSPESNLLIPHVGGRRCNLGWHHPKLERLIEIGSAWGLFEWLLRDAVKRGYKLGVCANSDEHRGRCGGGVPGTAVFGTKGGLTGVLAGSLDRATTGKALRARHTFATTGERLVGLLSTAGGALQGDEIVIEYDQKVELKYAFFGSSGFSSIEAFDATGQIFKRALWEEDTDTPRESWRTIRVTWGGARLYDRYREAVWDGNITISDSSIQSIEAFGGISYIPERETITLVNENEISFQTHTSGDFDGVNIVSAGDLKPTEIRIDGNLGGYVKVGDPLKGNPHRAQPTFHLKASWEEALQPGGKTIEIQGGADLFIRIEVVTDVKLPTRVEGVLNLDVRRGEEKAVYFVGREWDGGKIITSPVFFTEDTKV